LVYVGSVIAEWSGKIITELGGPSGVTATIVAGAAQNAATIVQSQANIHNSWGTIFSNWMTAQITNDSALAVYLANANNADNNNSMLNTTNGINSLIMANANYSNANIIAQDNWGANNALYLNQINNWTNGTYNASLTMVNLLTQIRDSLRLQNA